MIFLAVALFFLEIFHFVIETQEMLFRALTVLHTGLIQVQWWLLWRFTIHLYVLSKTVDEYFFQGAHCLDCSLNSQQSIFNVTSFQSEWI
jgi:hypothetical protein